MTLQALPNELAAYLLLADAVIITDQEHVIIDVNKQYELITEYPKEYILGKKAGVLKSTHTPQATYDDMKSTLNHHVPWSGVFTNRKRSGELWHSSITITPIIFAGTLYYVGIFRELEQLSEGLYISEEKKVETQRELLKVLAISCEIRDPGIEAHLVRVQELTEQLVEAYVQETGKLISREYRHNITHCSILHDIGKSGIPEGILYKPGPLTHYERNIIEMHPQMGGDILKKISTEMNRDLFVSLGVAENIIMYHHEKWDGTGYPFKLKGETIPFEARVVAIVDVFDALTSRRPYKESWSKKETLHFLDNQKGKHFDPELIDVFLGCMRN